MEEQLKNYIQQRLAAGASKDVIRTELLSNHWSAEKVNELLGESETSPEEVSSPQVPEAQTTVSKIKSPVKNILILAGILVFIASSAGAVYVLLDGLFGNKAPYSEDNLVSGIVASLQNMKTFTYSVSGTLEMQERDADAKPFELQSSATLEEYKTKYRRDYKRANAVSSILRNLSFSAQSGPYPKNLVDLEKPEVPSYGYGYNSTYSTLDPLTNREYSYRALPDDFELTVTFETLDALKAIQSSYIYNPEGTTVDSDSMTITFTKESNSYFYLPSSLPKPFYEQFSDMLVYLPPELYFKGNISAAADLTKENPDFQISVEGEGDFGDLVYKMAGDLMRKDEYWYMRIRNMPSLFAGFFSYEKGTWIRASNEWLESNTGKSSISVASYLIPTTEEEESYRKMREELGTFYRAVLTIADEEKVLLVKNEPVKEKIDGETLFRYDLTYNADNLVSFIERVVEESQKYEATRNLDVLNDAALLEYLKSDEFQAVFDYYNNNLNLSFLVNKEGFIRSVDYSIRLVPGDNATLLAGKQARFTLNTRFDAINEPVEIVAPDEFKDIEEVVEEQSSNSYLGTSNVGNASIKQQLSNIRSSAELTYNSNNYSYAAVCDDSRIVSSMESAQMSYSESSAAVRRNMKPMQGSVSCLSGKDWYVVQAPLIDSDTELFEFWCVDSTGFAGGTIELLSFSDKSCPQ